MTSSYDPSTQIRNMGLFRTGQPFDYPDMEYLADRETIANFIIYDLVERAIGKGFSLKQDENEHPQDKAIQDKIKPIYEDFTIGASKERLFGSLTYEVQQENERIFLNTFDPRDFGIEFDKFDKIVKLDVTERIKFFDSEQVLEKRDIDSKDFENFLYRYRKGKRERNKGVSYLESIHDVLIGIQTLDESCVYFIIRVGAGLKIIYVPKDKLNDAEYMAELEESIRSMNAENTTMILGTDVGEEPTRVELLTGQAIDFNTLLDFFLKFISLKTGIPITILQGVTPGQLEGGKINETLLFDVLQKIQKNYEPLLRWIIDRIAALNTIEMGEYEIEWLTREAVDEVGKQDLLTKRIDNFIKLRNDIGTTHDIAASMSELEINEDDLDQDKLEEKRLMRENLMNRPDGEEDDNEEPTEPDGDAEEEETEDSQ